MKQYKERQYEINQEIEEHTQADENYHITASTVFSLANRALEIFESSEPNGKRQLLSFMLQNCRLSGKNLLFDVRSPFNTILETAHHSSVGRVVEEVRTVFERRDDTTIYIPIF